jgi:hypothetical protein
MEPILLQSMDMGLSMWAALASLMSLMLGWLFKRTFDNDVRCEENRAANDTIKARLYGESARTDDGDVNQLQLRIKHLEKTQTDVLNAKQDMERMKRDLYGADGDNRRTGLVNDVYAGAELICTAEHEECNAEGDE